MLFAFTGLVSVSLSYQPLNSHSIALSWTKFATEYVVHWYPVENIEGIQWIKVVDAKVHITGRFDWMV